MNACTPHSTHPALSRLTDRSLLRTLGHIGGRWTAAPDAADFTVTDPASGAQVARVAALGVVETKAASFSRSSLARSQRTDRMRTAPASCVHGRSSCWPRPRIWR